MTRADRAVLAVLVLLPALPAAAEPMFLSRQYARCANCHFSPAGGGMLTPYGRSLSREDLSTTGRSAPGQQGGREQEFLFGLLGGRLGDLSLGVNLRPSHLRFEFEGTSSTRDLLMNADVTAAWRRGGFTAYFELGRQPFEGDTRVDSFEHWVAYNSENGYGVRAGRFLPAYGVRFADHSSFNRAPLGFGTDDQLYALELSHATDRHLLQLTLSPGRADALVDDDGSAAFTAVGRAQIDLGSRAALVASGLYQAASDLEPEGGLVGLAVGVAPASRLSLWGQADLRLREGTSAAYTLTSEVAVEVYTGIWVKIVPQFRTENGDSSAGTFRLGAGLDLLPRTHWNVNLGYYRDRDRQSDRTFTTLLAQLHLYL
jgi:hypothetical protein